ncbi:uncharacterized protein LOC121381877 isoform X2 [Gigantopelta aegis]|nr:uncharacterized protein LOC121381877 isoform X2 [Gigantopelta aegis]
MVATPLQTHVKPYEAPASVASEQTCTPGSCGKFNYYDIPKYYGGLFKTESEIRQVEKAWGSKHRREFGSKWMTFWIMLLHGMKRTKSSTVSSNHWHDYDQCCPTTYDYVAYQSMINIYGQRKFLVHLSMLNPPKYQWIRTGRCHSAPHFCYGTCRIEDITLFMLVFDISKYPPFSFDAFSVRGYCSCKSSWGVKHVQPITDELKTTDEVSYKSSKTVKL